MRCAPLPLVCVGCLVLLNACVGSASKHIEARAQAEDQPTPAASALRTGDRLRVTVYGEDRLSGEYEIDDGGFVSLPLTGPAKAAGLSPGEFQASLTDKLKSAYLKDPRVTIDTLAVRPFYILGEVEKPGAYPYRSGLDIWRAMAVAGGQTYRASTSTITIQRAGETDFHDYKLAGTVTIGPGDVIRVPERWF